MDSRKTNQAIRFPYFVWIFAVIWILELFSFLAYIITLSKGIISGAVSASDLFMHLISTTRRSIVCIFYVVLMAFLFEKRRTTAYILPFIMFACGEALELIYMLCDDILFFGDFHHLFDHLFANYFPLIIKIVCWIIFILFIKSALGTKSNTFFQKPFPIYSVPFLYAIAVILYFSLTTTEIWSMIWFIGQILIALGMFFTIRWIMHPEPAVPYKDIAKKTMDNDALSNDPFELSRFRSSVILNVLWHLITCGLWQYVWVWRITSFTNHAENEKYRNPLTKLLLYMLVPFYKVFWIYTSANRLDKMGRDRKSLSEISVGCLVLAFFIPLISFILMQDKLNRIADYSASVPMSTPPIPSEAAKAHTNPALDELLQLKQLLDMGAISQDEYDVKKKQILGLDDETS